MQKHRNVTKLFKAHRGLGKKITITRVPLQDSLPPLLSITVLDPE